MDLDLKKGEFVLIAGNSGSGKTTLLNRLYTGYEKLGWRCGFVMQNFDAQIVTDKVWHEISFGLENLGTPADEMHRRVAEAAGYFGITDWLDRNTETLSGGQKQLVNLASVMALSPDLLLLDEPVSQLDPVAASNFLAMIKKINRELGVTVVVVEQRLEELFSAADRIVFLNQGTVAFNGTPIEVTEKILAEDNDLKEYLPASARIAIKLKPQQIENVKDIPLSVAAGRMWMENSASCWSGDEGRQAEGLAAAKAEPRKERRQSRGAPTAIKIKNLTFGYDKNVPVLEDLELDVKQGEIFAVLGANGSGKSTLLKCLAGIKKPLKGKICSEGKSVFLLPQAVRNIFTKRTCREELEECGWKPGNPVKALAAELNLERHPYDLSGGEMQKLALEKILLKRPDIVLLDEPTKGLDCSYKNNLGTLLHKLSDEGITIILVSHDLEFCAAFADRATLMFQGRLVGTAPVREFFACNNFYTTAAARMTRGFLEGVVSPEDLK